MPDSSLSGGPGQPRLSHGQRLSADTTSALEHVTDGFIAYDADWRFLYLNRSAEEYLGRSREELLGRVLWDAFPELAETPAGRALREAAESGGTQRIEVGSVVTAGWVECTVYPSGEGTVVYFRDVTDRRRAEEALRQAEQRFRVALAGTRVVVWEQDPQLRYTWVYNPDPGFEPDSVLGRTDAELLERGEDAEAVESLKRRVLRERVRLRKQVRLLIGGEERIYDLVAEPRESPEGELQGLCCTAVDVTEHEQALEALRHSEERFASMVSLSADAIIAVDEDQRIVLFNGAAEETFGYEAAEVLGRPLEVLLPGTVAGRHREEVLRFARSGVRGRRMGERRRVEGRRRDGSSFPAEVSISRLQLQEGVLFTAILRDTTERQRVQAAERLLAEAGAVLGPSLEIDAALSRCARLATAEFVDWCVAVLSDDEGRLFVRASHASTPELASQLGPAPSQEVPADAWIARALAQPIGGAAAAGSGQDGDVERSDAGRLPESPSPAPLAALTTLAPALEPAALAAFARSHLLFVPMRSGSRTTGALLLGREASREDFDAYDEWLSQQLGQRVAAAIENARLYQSSQHAVAIRDEILGIVAHDLRSPLHAVGLAVSGLEVAGVADSGDAKTARYLEMMRRSLGAMDELIQDLLEVARLETAGPRLNLAATPVAALLSGVTEQFAGVAEQRQVELRVDSGAGLPDLKIDRPRLLRALGNLVGNAIKFTEAGGRVTVSAVAEDRCVRLVVADTGPGIAAEDLPHIFDRFWQARASQAAGAGLGLSIARSLVEAHGGRLEVESTLGVGTTFSFGVPVASPLG